MQTDFVVTESRAAPRRTARRKIETSNSVLYPTLMEAVKTAQDFDDLNGGGQSEAGSLFDLLCSDTQLEYHQVRPSARVGHHDRARRPSSGCPAVPPRNSRPLLQTKWPAVFATTDSAGINGCAEMFPAVG